MKYCTTNRIYKFSKNIYYNILYIIIINNIMTQGFIFRLQTRLTIFFKKKYYHKLMKKSRNMTKTHLKYSGSFLNKNLSKISGKLSYRDRLVNEPFKQASH